jgi:hypothetical protein
VREQRRGGGEAARDSGAGAVGCCGARMLCGSRVAVCGGAAGAQEMLRAQMALAYKTGDTKAAHRMLKRLEPEDPALKNKKK